MPMARLTSGLKGRAFRRAVNPSKPAGFSRRGNSFSMPPGFEFPRWLNSLLKKSEQQIPRGLKPARNDKNKAPIGTTKVVP